MYNRYFLWQFAGRGPASDPTVISMGANRREDGVDLSQFGLPLAFILGIIGMIYHARKDERMAFSVMSLFIMTGYAIILYLNQDDPQPRERDYSYVGSFFAFSIWVGLGTAAISESITKYISDQKLSKNLISIALILQIVFVPVVMASTNYFSHDRSGNFVAWDYSYNILQSCEPNGVIFTNGDNDTFPLWYLQEVEKLRTDVAVVNLSLLNTPWYIKQWRDKREGDTKFIDLSDKQIDKLTSSLQRWETKTMRIPVSNDPQNEKGYIEWEMKPTYGGQALRVQDMMILHILDESRWKIPIYFAVTVSGSNRIGLDDYMDMQGLTFQLKSHKTKSIDKEKMYKNLMTDIGTPKWSTNFEHASFYDTIESYDESLENSKKVGSSIGEEVGATDNFKSWSRQYQPGYMFRNLGNNAVYYNKQTKRLLQNYRSAYMQLAVVYYMEYQRKDRKKDNRSKDELTSLKETIVKILNKMEQNIPGDVIEIQSEDLHYQIARIYGDLDEKESMRAILEKLISNENGKPLNRVEYANTFYRELNSKNRAISILEELRQSYMRKERMVLNRGFSNKTVRKGEWNRWEKAYPEIISSLVFIYRENNQFADAEVILSEWVQRNPSDENAKKILEEVRSGG